jgi:hypothetical protein
MQKYYTDSFTLLKEPNVPAAYTDAVYLAADVDERIEAMSLAIGAALGHLNASVEIKPNSGIHEAFKDLMESGR